MFKNRKSKVELLEATVVVTRKIADIIVIAGSVATIYSAVNTLTYKDPQSTNDYS